MKYAIAALLGATTVSAAEPCGLLRATIYADRKCTLPFRDVEGLSEKDANAIKAGETELENAINAFGGCAWNEEWYASSELTCNEDGTINFDIFAGEQCTPKTYLPEYSIDGIWAKGKCTEWPVEEDDGSEYTIYITFD